MREFRYDTATRRAYLNGRPYFVRGSNITLHRFFEDPESGALPWDEAWVRRLLVDLPKKLHWNAFRFCIGPVPDKWLDIADEAGLLDPERVLRLDGRPGVGQWRRAGTYDVPEMIRQYSDWMRDNWNHPSVAVWDANNETKDAVFGDTIIPAVRPLDLSNRPWENSYNQPVGPDDPVEDHPYLMQGEAMGGEPFRMTDLERRPGRAEGGAPGGPGDDPERVRLAVAAARRGADPAHREALPEAARPGLDEGAAARAERVPARGQDRVLAGAPQLRGHPPLRLPDLQLPRRLHRRPLRGREGAEAQPVVRGLHGRGDEAARRLPQLLPADASPPGRPARSA